MIYECETLFLMFITEKNQEITRQAKKKLRTNQHSYLLFLSFQTLLKWITAHILFSTHNFTWRLWKRFFFSKDGSIPSNSVCHCANRSVYLKYPFWLGTEVENFHHYGWQWASIFILVFLHILKSFLGYICRGILGWEVLYISQSSWCIIQQKCSIISMNKTESIS